VASPDKTPQRPWHTLFRRKPELEAEVVRLRQLEDLCRRWFTDDDLSVHAGALHEEIMAWFASPDKPPGHATTHHIHTHDTGKRVRGG